MPIVTPEISKIVLLDGYQYDIKDSVARQQLAEKGTYTKPSGGIPASDLAADVQTSLGKADTALQTAPVTSVNEQTGAVVLSASDVGAGTYTKPSTGIPLSDFANDAKMVVLSYGISTWADFLAAYTTNRVVYCRASSNSNPASGSQTRMAFLAYVNRPDSPTEVEFQYYRSVATYSDSQQGDQVYVYKLNSNSGWSVTVRSAFSKIEVGTGLSKSYNSTSRVLTLSNNVSYESKTAVENGTDESLVTTGEKYIWNRVANTAIPAPTSPETGAFLVWNGNAWVARSLEVLVAIDDSSGTDPSPSPSPSGGGSSAITEVTISTAGAVSQALNAETIYHFTGAVSSLSLTLNAVASGQLAQYHFDFSSGSTPATITITGVTWPDGSFTPEANTHYEVDILNGYGVWAAW